MQPNTNPAGKATKTDPAAIDPKTGAPKASTVNAQPQRKDRSASG